MPRNLETRAVSAASGTALSNVLALLPLALNGKTIGRGHLTLNPRNQAASAAVMRWALTPRLSVLVSKDSFAAAPTDASDNAQDGAAGTVINFDAMPPNPVGFIYLGAPNEFRGVQAGTFTNANAIASVMTAEIWNGSAWVALTIVDGSASGGATLAQAGNITWTIPLAQAWQPGLLFDIVQNQSGALLRNTNLFLGSPDLASVQGIAETSLYWIRLKVSVALSATVRLQSLLALARSAAYAEWPVATTTLASPLLELEDNNLNTTPLGVGAIEALVDTGTANLLASLRGEFIS